ncbi:MAG: PHP domain-containing protein [Desulfonauticus sp.]|nr:PHP domain-containing protein [Desulfonauticus sp.]
MRMDLHVHSNISPCSNMGLDDLIKRAYELGLDGICITDHDTLEAKNILSKIPTYGITVIVGMEYATPQGDFLIFGEIDNIPKGLTAKDLLHTLKNRNSMAIAAHPFRKKRRFDSSLLACMEVIEGVNGRCNWEENILTMNWALDNLKKITGGSDAHTLKEIGRVITYFKKPILNVWDLIDNLKSGSYYPIISGNNFEMYSCYTGWHRRQISSHIGA